MRQTYRDLDQGNYALGIADFTDQALKNYVEKQRYVAMYFSALGGRMFLGAEMCEAYAEFFGAWFATMDQESHDS